MPAADQDAFHQEWITLQNNHEQHEKNCLSVKLVAVVLFGVALAWGFNDSLIGALLGILWFQEGMLRTFQSRLGARILRIEQALRPGMAPAAMAFQLHSEWLAERQGVVGRLIEVGRSASAPLKASIAASGSLAARCSSPEVNRPRYSRSCWKCYRHAAR